jgi:tetratricopeptide (TPR) repeat protein
MSTNGPDDAYPEEPTSPSSPSSRRVPFAENWDRYELLDFLGKGGMGLVYRARDRRLGRIVAIKFVLEASAKMTARFLGEARAQSRIDHPNICRVYEVGEVAGHAYIALQLVKGESLQRVARRLSLDEKITVMRDVAKAIHEAHRHGIVHRDLKPSNVLVERDPEGRWFPIVMDFGLARELPLDPATPDSEFVQGTPSYMSPEQARGDLCADRRSDVYSLGATLYELVTGQVPFANTSASQTVVRLLSEDPPAPRSLSPGLPPDLEVVILQCLAKDPAQRYPSARALADDLERYLDGEPILGRRHSAWRRARTTARRHPVLTAVGACLLVFAAGAAALGIHARAVMREARASADRRACLNRRLSEEVGKIEGSLREAYLRPLHDVRPDRQRARAALHAIETSLRAPDNPDAPYVRAVLGRGHLALREWGAAVDELQASQSAGPSLPESHEALGRALGEMYLHTLGGIGRPADEKDSATWLATRRAALVKKYLDPARRELELSGDKSPISRIRIALYSRDFAAAEQQAREAADADPGALEASEIAGEAAFLAATEAFDRGDYDRALPTLERAAASFARASLIARSDGALYRAAAETWLLVAEVAHRRRRSSLASLQRALDLLDHGALVADPDDAVAHVTKAYVLLSWYRSEAPSQPADETALLERVVRAAARAVTLDARDPRALVALGIGYIYRGSYEFFHGSPGASWWHLASMRLEEALTISPDDPRANNALGLTHRWRGDEFVKAGQDPSNEYAAAQKSFARALTLAPGYFRACVNQAELSTLAAEYAEALGRDPLSTVEEARRAGRQCLAADPTSYAVLDVLARGELALAGYLLKTGGDPTRALAGARDLLVRSESGLPDHTEMWFQRGVAARIEAAYLVRRDGDPTQVINQGRLYLQNALRQMPSSARSYVEIARLDLINAVRARSVRPHDDAVVLEEARQSAERAIEIDGRLPWAHLVAAEIYLRTAAAAGGSAAAERGVVHADEASRLFPGIPGGRDVRDALERLRKQ